MCSPRLLFTAEKPQSSQQLADSLFSWPGTESRYLLDWLKWAQLRRWSPRSFFQRTTRAQSSQAALKDLLTVFFDRGLGIRSLWTS